MLSRSTLRKTALTMAPITINMTMGMRRALMSLSREMTFSLNCWY